MPTLIDRLRKPSALFSSNWAGILWLLPGATAVPALAGVTRVVTDLDRYADEGFVTVTRTVRATWRRDLPVSLTLVVVTVMGLANLFALINSESAVRVLAVGFLVPVLWAALVFLGAYTAVAGTAPLEAGRVEVLSGVADQLRRRPFATLTLPVIQVLVTPIVVFPPLTVAVGLSLPAWIITEWLRLKPAPAPEDEAPAPA